MLDGDIIVKADHHIAWVAKDGAIIEAQDTDVGVRSTGKFILSGTGKWTHLVRLPTGAVKPPAPPEPEREREYIPREEQMR